jgi:hypothetical protein
MHVTRPIHPGKDDGGIRDLGKPPCYGEGAIRLDRVPVSTAVPVEVYRIGGGDKVERLGDCGADSENKRAQRDQQIYSAMIEQRKHLIIANEPLIRGTRREEGEVLAKDA